LWRKIKDLNDLQTGRLKSSSGMGAAGRRREKRMCSKRGGLGESEAAGDQCRRCRKMGEEVEEEKP